jgi:hypothetical protein
MTLQVKLLALGQDQASVKELLEKNPKHLPLRGKSGLSFKCVLALNRSLR